ncbi:MAG: hypothetical protein EGR13_07335, partial [Coprococcus comes]|nr:hypothetical protein [Coprococcus comes]
ERASELYEKFKNKYYFIDFLNKELIRSKVGFIITDGIIRCHKDLNLNKTSELGDVSYNYNHIQMKLARQQDIMLKQEQLSVLGEMAGG